ncbi:MAG: peptidoglycan DD-metalloendopeptidase family protein [Candidatus Moranbacteria bacterium]|nr:peptidoglycan DD-metalloendopeptidase family protein [Candidatus Moranbacteria bacterium]
MARICYVGFLGIILLTAHTANAQTVMDVQLPFYDGKSYRCTQNSNDSPTHNNIYTMYDLDFGLSNGSIVVAASDGVMHYGSNPNGFGTYAKIDHGNGYWTMYGHLSGYIANEGDVVAGQPIAYSGNTGLSIGSGGGYHLHFGVHSGSGVGNSKKMSVYALNKNTNSSGYFDTGLQNETEFVCGLTSGNFYESRPVGSIFSDYQCKSLTSGGVLCWSGNPTTCEDGDNHVWYHKNSEGAKVSESNSSTWQKCSLDSGQIANIFSYLDGGYGVGGVGPGSWTDATDSATSSLPDFVVNKTWLETPWGVETYKFGLGESFNTKAQSENIGDGSCLNTDATQEITGHFYLSKGYKEDVHSGDGAWRRLDSTNTHCSNLGQGETNTETKSTNVWEWITEPGIYNVVYCIDHPQDDHNNGGDHAEKHESNNCSTEAVFEVTADQIVNPDPRFVDFTTNGLGFRGTPPIYAGSQAHFGAWVTNKGNTTPGRDIRSNYSVQCSGTARIQLADDGTPASALSPGASAFEENIGAVTLPNASGACVAYFCADYQNAVVESNEANNCTTFNFTLKPRPTPNFKIIKIEDKKGCCTTNRGDKVYPRVWTQNTGTAAPLQNVAMRYYIRSAGTGNVWWEIANDTMEPRELPPGGTDEESLDSGWKIPSGSAWKNQWHEIKACVDPLNAIAESNESDNCMSYSRFSKK